MFAISSFMWFLVGIGCGYNPPVSSTCCTTLPAGKKSFCFVFFPHTLTMYPTGPFSDDKHLCASKFASLT